MVWARVPWQRRHVEEEPITLEGSGHLVNPRKARLGEAAERSLGDVLKAVTLRK